MKNNEIASWLQGSGDYQQGRALFEKYSKRKSLINLFRRKHKPEVLRYNLQKLLSMPMVGQACESRQDGPGTIERKLVITDGRVRL